MDSISYVYTYETESIFFNHAVFYEKWKSHSSQSTKRCGVERAAIVWWRCTSVSRNLLAPILG
jgi:hypothetical protein